MKILKVLALMILLPNAAFAADNFAQYYEVNSWHKHNLTEKVVLTARRDLSKKVVRQYEGVFEEASRKFSLATGINTKLCRERLEIRLVSLGELNSKKYFPTENVYGNVTGRYFRHSNTLYMVPVFRWRHHNWESWRKSYAHELAHYFFDACSVSTLNNRVEHMAIDTFERRF